MLRICDNFLPGPVLILSRHTYLGDACVCTTPPVACRDKSPPCFMFLKDHDPHSQSSCQHKVWRVCWFGKDHALIFSLLQTWSLDLTLRSCAPTNNRCDGLRDTSAPLHIPTKHAEILSANKGELFGLNLSPLEAHKLRKQSSSGSKIVINASRSSSESKRGCDCIILGQERCRGLTLKVERQMTLLITRFPGHRRVPAAKTGSPFYFSGIKEIGLADDEKCFGTVSMPCTRQLV